jgi:hypothetical protein
MRNDPFPKISSRYLGGPSWAARGYGGQPSRRYKELRSACQSGRKRHRYRPATVAPPLPPGVVHAPGVRVWGGARVVLDTPENLQDRVGRSDADSASDALCNSDGHHVRNRTRSTRRRTRFSAALRPRALRAARACHLFLQGLRVSDCARPLTAPRPSAAIWRLRDGRKTRRFSRVTRWRCAARRQRPTNRRTRCAAPARMIGFRL